MTQKLATHPQHYCGRPFQSNFGPTQERDKWCVRLQTTAEAALLSAQELRAMRGCVVPSCTEEQRKRPELVFVQRDDRPDQSRAARFLALWRPIVGWPFFGQLRNNPFTVHCGRFSYGQILQFLGGNTTARCKTLNSVVLMESPFCSEFGTKIAF